MQTPNTHGERAGASDALRALLMRIATRSRGRYLIPLCGQAGSSLSSLAIGLLLIRGTTPAEYGLYVVGFSLALYLSSIQDGLVSAPVIVRASALALGPRTRYLRWNARAAIAWWLGIAAAGSVLGEALGLRWPRLGPLGFGLATAFASLGWIAWDLQRAQAFALDRLGRLLLVDLTYIVAIAMGCAIMWAAGLLTACAALVCIGMAGTCSWIIAAPVARSVETKVVRLRRSLAYWWGRGRWSLASSQITWLQSQGYIYLVSALLGLEALAKVSAVRLLFAPLATLLAAWTKSVLPRLSQRAAAGQGPEVRSLLEQSCLVLLGILVLWASAIAALSGSVAEALFAGKYADLRVLSMCWGLAFAASFLRGIWQTGLRAFGGFAVMSRIAGLALIVSASATCLGALAFRETGAVLGLALAELIAGVLLARTVIAHCRERS